MPTNTTNYSFQKPTVSGDSGAWGGYLNSNWDSVDSLLGGDTAITGIDIDSGSIDGAAIGANSASTGAFTTCSISSTFTLGGTAVTSTGTELNYVAGVSSAIQTQLNSKAATPTIQATGVTATSGQFLVVTNGGITITLPATPSAGDNVTVKDGTGAAATTSFTVARNGSNIASSATDLTFDKNFAEITMTYIDATIGWSV